MTLGQAFQRLRWHLVDAGPPWAWPTNTCPPHMRLLRWTAWQARRRRLPWLLWPFGALATVLAMAVLKVKLCWNCSKGYAQETHGLGQFLRVYGIKMRHGVEPFDQFAIGMHSEDAIPADHALTHADASFVLHALTPKPIGVLMRNKSAFETFATAQLTGPTLQMVGTLAQIMPTDDPSALAARLPKQDLIAKPRHGSEGQGITLWRFGPAGYTHIQAVDNTATTGPIDADGLAHDLIRLSGRNNGGLLIQRFVQPHPMLDDLANPAPPVLRVNTGLYPDDRRCVISILLQQAPQDSVTTHNGRIRAIDPATGRIMAYRKGVVGGPMDHMLLKGADYDQRPMPLWDGLTDGLMALHAALPYRTPIVGWDVLLGPDAAVVLEANAVVTPYIDQLIGLGPAAETLWSHLLAEWVACRA